MQRVAGSLLLSTLRSLLYSMNPYEYGINTCQPSKQDKQQQKVRTNGANTPTLA